MGGHPLRTTTASYLLNHLAHRIDRCLITSDDFDQLSYVTTMRVIKMHPIGTSDEPGDNTNWFPGCNWIDPPDANEERGMTGSLFLAPYSISSSSELEAQVQGSETVDNPQPACLRQCQSSCIHGFRCQNIEGAGGPVFIPEHMGGAAHRCVA